MKKNLIEIILINKKTSKAHKKNLDIKKIRYFIVNKIRKDLKFIINIEYKPYGSGEIIVDLNKYNLIIKKGQIDEKRKKIDNR